MATTFNESYERSVNGGKQDRKEEENQVMVLGSSCTVLSNNAPRNSSLSSQNLSSTVGSEIGSSDGINGVPTVEATGVLLEVRALWVPPSSFTSSVELPLNGPTKRVLSSYSSVSAASLVSLTPSIASSSIVSDDRKGLVGCCSVPLTLEGGRQSVESQQGYPESQLPTAEEQNEGKKTSEKNATRLRLSLPRDWFLRKSREECFSQVGHKTIEESEKEKSEVVKESQPSATHYHSVSLSSSTPKMMIGHLPLRFLKKGPQGAAGGTPQTEKLRSSLYELYGFVRVKDSDHRLSGWYPLQRIDLKVPAVLTSPSSLPFSSGTSSPSLLLTSRQSSSFSFPSSSSTSKSEYSGSSPSCSSPVRSASHTKTGSAMQSIRASHIIFRPILSSVYSEVTSGMSRTLRAERILDYFDERLLRDGRTPTTIRYFIYAQQFIFAPWYYAPYGLLHHSYDPTLPFAPRRPFCSSPLSNVLESGSYPSEESGVEGDAREQNTKGGMNKGIQQTIDNACSSSISLSSSFHFSDTDSTVCNPYIRDAYLCPFSLRIYSTFEQMQYEIQNYRSGGTVSFSSKSSSFSCSSSTQLLRPPGLKIYEDLHRGIAVFEVNGNQHVTYCRHLFLIGKSFLEKKLAGHDVHNYYFFVVCLHERYFPHFRLNRSDPSLHQKKMTSSVVIENNQHPPVDVSKKASNGTIEEEIGDDHDAWFFAGYFSWEKQVESCNLACIVTLPCFGMQQAHHSAAASEASMRIKDVGGLAGTPRIPKGIGQFLIRMSYELAYRRGHYAGTPERPLSDLGELAYLHYWGTVLLEWWYHHMPSSEKGRTEPHPSFPHRIQRQKRKNTLEWSLSSPHSLRRVSYVPISTLQNTENTSTTGDTERQKKNKLASGLREGRKDSVSPTLLTSSQNVKAYKAPEVFSSVSYFKRPLVKMSTRGCGRRRRFEWGNRASSLNEKEKDIMVVEDEDEANSCDDDDVESCSEYVRMNSQSGLPNSTVSSSPARLNYSLTDIAKLVGLEVNDTRRAVLHKGLLQWSAEDRAPKWVLPKEFLRKEHEKFIQRRVANPDTTSPDFYAAFLPRLLVPKGLSYQTPPHYWDNKDPQTYF